LTVINTKYISQLEEGQSLRTSLPHILNELSKIVDKYEDIIIIDEAFLEGMLYIATSRCAITWDLKEQKNDN
jgi:hypothetical protein